MKRATGKLGLFCMYGEARRDLAESWRPACSTYGMRYFLLALLCLGVAGCSRDDGSTAKQAGRDAYKVGKAAEKAAKKIGSSLKKAGKEAAQGYKEAKREDQAKRAK